MPFSETQGIFDAGHMFDPQEVVTAGKLQDLVRKLRVDWNAFRTAFGLEPQSQESHFRVKNGVYFQLRNNTTGKWHTVWIEGTPGQETFVIGTGEDA